MKQRLVDWWRGYRQKDLESVRHKLSAPEAAEPGALISITRREMRALLAHNAAQNLRHCVDDVDLHPGLAVDESPV